MNVKYHPIACLVFYKLIIVILYRVEKTRSVRGKSVTFGLQCVLIPMDLTITIDILFIYPKKFHKSQKLGVGTLLYPALVLNRRFRIERKNVKFVKWPMSASPEQTSKTEAIQ